MQERHRNRQQYFNEQALTTDKYVIPYIEQVINVNSSTRVLEIGCGEGGNLKPFVDRGCQCVGVDILDYKIANAIKFFEDHALKANVRFIVQDIYKVEEEDFKFDLIIMRDVIEHIPNQMVFLGHLKRFLKPGAKIFFGFPAWRMPFGGHQQVCDSKILSKLPYFHLLPRPIYRFILKSFGETDKRIADFMDIVDTRISINRFMKIVRKNDYQIDKRTLYLINPNYEIKFKLKQRVVPAIMNIPYLRDFYTTAVYSIISLKED